MDRLTCTPANLEVHNNLVLENNVGDVVVVAQSEDGKPQHSQEKSDRAAQVWRFGGNWRDLSGTTILIPLAKGDHKLDASFQTPSGPGQARFPATAEQLSPGPGGSWEG